MKEKTEPKLLNVEPSVHSGREQKLRKTIVFITKYGFLWGYALLSLALFAWVFISSFKSNREIFANPFSLPESFALDNYVRAWSSANIGSYFWNSLIVAIAVVVFTLILASMVSYVIARFTFRGNSLLWAFFALGLAVPMQALLLPTFLKMSNLGLRDSLWALIIVYTVFGLPRAVFFTSRLYEAYS